MTQPLLSIVIANYNYGRFLEDAIQSVIAQGMGDKIELIICDAASTDNSVDVIKKYERSIRWWCSEPDGGQSAAFNKGFAHANGRFLTWLNADDVMMPGTLKSFEIAVGENPTCEWFVGGVVWLDKNMMVIKCGRGRPFSKYRATAGVINVCGPSSFFAKELFEKAGRVDERFVYTMDTDLWRRFYYKCGATYLPFIKYAWGLRLHEEAKMSAHNFVSSGQQDKKHPKWKQIEQERVWMEDHYKPKVRLSFVRQLLSMNLCGSLMGRYDSFRYKGRYYLECIK